MAQPHSLFLLKLAGTLNTCPYLEWEAGGCGHLMDSTLFHFTDNLVMYFVISSGSSKSPELQCLLHCLKYLELSLAICLEVVHILGAHMIDKGIDGLSQGLHLTGGHPMHPPHAEMQWIFEGVHFTLDTLQWAHAQIASMQKHHDCIYMDATMAWAFHQVSQQATLWFLAPEWARGSHKCMD